MSTEAQESQTASNRPVMSFHGSGGIHVAIWKNKTESDQTVYSIKIDRRYKDDSSDEFKSTSYLRDGDLLRAQKLLDEADAWIEQDKQRSRVASTTAAGR